MMDPICSLQSFVFAGCGAAKGMDKVMVCCFVSNQFIIYNFFIEFIIFYCLVFVGEKNCQMPAKCEVFFSGASENIWASAPK